MYVIDFKGKSLADSRYRVFSMKIERMTLDDLLLRFIERLSETILLMPADDGTFPQLLIMGDVEVFHVDR